VSAVGVFTTNSYELTYISISPAIRAYLLSSDYGHGPVVFRRTGLSLASSFIAALLLLLMLAGDVEHNPGPPLATATPTADRECKYGLFKLSLGRPRCCMTNARFTKYLYSYDNLTIMPALRSSYDDV